MKSIILTTITCVISFWISAQSFNRWSVSAGFGNHFGLYPTPVKIRALNLHSYHVGGRYMFSSYIGISLTAGYDFLDFEGAVNSNLLHTDLQGVINIGNLCNFRAKTSWFGLLYHSGIGATHLWSKSTKNLNADDPLFKNTDDMLNIVSGFTPQFKLGNRISLFLDYSVLINFRQDYSYDFSIRLTSLGVGGIVNFTTVGLSISLGKYSSHSDWVMGRRYTRLNY